MGWLAGQGLNAISGNNFWGFTATIVTQVGRMDSSVNTLTTEVSIASVLVAEPTLVRRSRGFFPIAPAVTIGVL